MTAGLLQRSRHPGLRLKPGKVVLKPGEMRTAEIEIRLPDQLEAHARYIGGSAVYQRPGVCACAPG